MDKKDELINLQRQLIELMEGYFECYNHNAMVEYYRLGKLIRELEEDVEEEEEEEIEGEILLG